MREDNWSRIQVRDPLVCAHQVHATTGIGSAESILEATGLGDNIIYFG
jgi:hypothetical protein